MLARYMARKEIANRKQSHTGDVQDTWLKHFFFKYFYNFQP